jgi:hypothetical protein
MFYVTVDAHSLRDYMPAVPVLLPASSWAGRWLRRRPGAAVVTGALPRPRLPAQLTEVAADSGGFVAARRWGDYRYTLEQYADWLATFTPQWAAMMDYCCEDELTAGRPGLVRERQRRTTGLAWRTWQEYGSAPWCWVPTVQGWHVEEYQRHSEDLAPLVRDMVAAYGADGAFRVGVGTLCRRADVSMIHAMVRAVASALPGVGLHLWGVKLGALEHPRGLPEAVVSVDSAAWDGRYGRGRLAANASGLRHRKYSYTVSLPRYLRKVEAALARPRQAMLDFEEVVS